MDPRLQKLNLCGIFSSASLWELLLTLIGAMCTDQSEKRPHAADNKIRHEEEEKEIPSNNIRSSSSQIGNYRQDVFN